MRITAPRSQNRLTTTRRYSLGVTLVEILITVLVTSVGLLGIAALHLTSLRNNYDATMRSQASMLAGDIADRMRSNRAAALAGSYNIASGATYATPATQAQTDVSQWKTLLGSLLPSGDGTVTLDATTNIVTIEVAWNERDTGVATFATLTEL